MCAGTHAISRDERLGTTYREGLPEIFAEVERAATEKEKKVKFGALIETNLIAQALWHISVSSIYLDRMMGCPHGALQVGSKPADCEARMDQYRNRVVLYRARLLLDQKERRQAHVRIKRSCQRAS